MTIKELYDDSDALTLSDHVHNKDATPSELVEECIRRIEEVNGPINAVIRTLYERARESATSHDGDSTFRGVPFLLKDLLQTIAGTPTGSGTRVLQDRNATVDGTYYTRLSKAGLITVGRTNSPEFGLVPVTEPEVKGPTRNPWNLERTCGGSSGGSGAAVAAGIVPMASGGDGGGSIRIPSSCCGLFGLKPTRGRTPAGPNASEYWNGFAIEHVLSKSVRDSAAALDATHGYENGAPYAAPKVIGTFLDAVTRAPKKLRIAFHQEPPVRCEKIHKDCIDALKDAVALCEELGHEVVELAPKHDQIAIGRAFVTVLGGNTSADLREIGELIGRPLRLSDVEVTTWLASMLGRSVSGADFAYSLRVLQHETRRLAVRYEDFDAVLTPTLAKPPIEIGELTAKGLEGLMQKAVAASGLKAPLKIPKVLDETVDRAFSFSPFTPMANITGQPSMSVPLFWNEENLPIGVMFTGRFGDEQTLFSLAAQLEGARPWQARTPPLHVSK